MQSIIIQRVATTAVMPLIAASGFAGYSYVNPNQQNQYGVPTTMSCTVLSTDMYYNYNNSSADIVNLQRFLIVRGYLRGTPDGYFDQATIMAVEQFQADNGLPITGGVDSQTRYLIQQISCGNGYGGNPNTGNGQLSIQGIDAPNQLTVGQSGTWTVHVVGWNINQGGGQLHYSVVWGDENTGPGSAAAYYPSTSVDSSGTFTHTYMRQGTFAPVFTVTDNYGNSVRASATTYVSAGTTYGNGYGGDGDNDADDIGSSNGYYHTNYCTSAAGWYDRSCYNTPLTYNGNNTVSTGYCDTSLGSYGRNCYNNNSTTYNGNGNYNNNYCTTSAGWYDRNCSNTNSTTYNENYNNCYTDPNSYNNGNWNGYSYPPAQSNCAVSYNGY